MQDYVKALVSSGGTGNGTYEVRVPLSWVRSKVPGVSGEPCLFIGPASDGACVAILTLRPGSRRADLSFHTMGVRTMDELGIGQVESHTVAQVKGTFRSVITKMVSEPNGTFGSGKSNMELN